MSAVYLVKRAPRPAGHKAPYHRVIICGKRRVANWEAGWSGERAWIWAHDRGHGAGGWLLLRWNGLDIDYGHVVRGIELPDGTQGAFVHEHTGREPWPLLEGAVWWDDKRMPGWLAEAGVVYAPDEFSQQKILDFIADDGAAGFGRATPEFWPEPAPKRRVPVTDGPRVPDGSRVRLPRTGGPPGEFKYGEIVEMMATIEEPNGRWERYTVRWEDGRETSGVSAAAIHHWNPDLVVDGAPAGGGAS